mgnify:CR=1 FL=1
MIRVDGIIIRIKGIRPRTFLREHLLKISQIHGVVLSAKNRSLHLRLFDNTFSEFRVFSERFILFL